MPITIQYGPAGLAGALAVQAGQGEGRLDRQRLGLQTAQLNLQAQHEANQVAAQNKAFELQQAVEDRREALQARTPVADHVKEKADIERADQQKEQEAIRKQMAKMRTAGIISEAEHEKGILAMLTGAKGLVTQLFEPQKPGDPSISNVKEVAIIQAKHRELRRPFYTRLQAIAKTLADEFSIEPKEKLQIEKGQLEAKIQAGMVQEAEEIDKIRQKGPGGSHPTAAAQATVDAAGNIITPSPASGMGTITYSQGLSESEQGIVDAVKKMAGPKGQFTIRGQGPNAPVTASTETPAQQPPVSAPDAQWNEQYQCWTVVRNGRLIKVQ
jgi:hypothetical protein